MEKCSKPMIAIAMVMAYMSMGAEAQSQNNVIFPNITGLFNNTMVTPGSVNISNVGCGSTKVCAAEPFNCDPAGSTSCFFFSATKTSGQDFSFQLEGQTMANGFIALGLLSPTSFSGPVYVCANNNKSVMFFSLHYQNGSLTQNNQLPVTSVMGSVTGQTVQCTFNATFSTATTTTNASTNFFIYIIIGNNNNGNLSIQNTVFISPAAVDLIVTNSTVTTKNVSATSASPVALGMQHKLSQALLTLLGVLGLMML
ncbi:hypothetical protein UPYG_G00236910 [Umbra pygmaea]|uniref:Ferric-chelate reductase 1 n=1 Tax=Umbra pygmaea TaxID=75934 RepID=A0ABD0WG35_UMBPY